jgi:oligosaccharyltransferase complex subunit gamma
MLLTFLLLAAAVWGAVPEEFLEKAAANGGVVRLDGISYDQLVTSDRDYSVSVQLTALGAQYKCLPCQHVAYYAFTPGCSLMLQGV